MTRRVAADGQAALRGRANAKALPRILPRDTPERAEGPGPMGDGRPYGDAMRQRRARHGTARRLLVGVTLLATTAALSACGAGDDSDSAAGRDTTVTTTAGTNDPGSATSAVAQAPLRDGTNFHPNDLADALLGAGVSAVVSLDGVPVELHHAWAEIDIDHGNGQILVYDDAESAAAREDRFRASFGSFSEVTRVRNVLVQSDPDLDPAIKAKVDGCLGA